MNPLWRALALALGSTCILVVRAQAAEFSFAEQTLTIPDGFIVEQVTTPDLVQRPILADFDQQGRLYVAESSGSNDPVQQQLQEKPHSIVRLEDSNGDGVYDRSVVFADKMMFPAGVMWFSGSLYVTAPPSIWKLTDTDGDGRADQREEWYNAQTLTGCANDLHGPYLGRDGWIYWCKGAFAQQVHELPNGNRFVSRAAHIFRRHSEGGGVEPVMTGGMDNPVDVVFTREGERIFTSTFLQHPGGGRRDGLIHAIYGGTYGKVHDVIDDHPKTGELLPVLTHLGPAAPSGLAYYESEHFDPEYRGDLFAALFNMHKVTRHQLQPTGATYQTIDSDFLVSNSTDFHPTDVLEDADGSLLVIDTGGWYKLCCPTSQLWKPDVLGAIYRVRRANTPRIKDPYGIHLAGADPSLPDWAELLGDPRPVVRRRALETLASSGDAALPLLKDVLENSSSEEARINAIWALTRIQNPAARELARAGLSDLSRDVRHAAAHSVAVSKDAGAVASLIVLLQQNEPVLTRAAAEALGRIGGKSAVQPLLAALSELEPALPGDSADRVLEHSLIYALIEIGDSEGTRHGLAHDSVNVRRAALIALDQMEPGELQPEEVVTLLSSPDPVLRETAKWIMAQHHDWGDALAEWFKSQLMASPGSGLVQEFAPFLQSREVQHILMEVAGDTTLPTSSRLTAFQVMADARPNPLPERWASAIIAGLESGTLSILETALDAVSSIDKPADSHPLSAALTRLATTAKLPAILRLKALALLPSGVRLEDSLFEFIRAQFTENQNPAIRRTSIEALGQAALTEEQLHALTMILPQATPMEITGLVPLFRQGSTERLGLELVKSLREGKGTAALQADRLKEVLSHYPPAVRTASADLMDLLQQDAEAQAAHLAKLLEELPGGDVRRGQAIFNSSRTACSSCHAIGYLGGDLGPDLTRIGQVRTERDLLEAVVYPSRSFVRSYEPVIVVTHDDREYSGVLRKDSPSELVLATGPGTEVRLSRNEVAQMRPGSISVMPQGLDQQLTGQELADLLAFLKATRW